MKKIVFYIPAIIFTAIFGSVAIIFGGIRVISPLVAVWLVLFFISGILLNKNMFLGSILGALPAIHMIYMGTKETGQIINEKPIGIVVLLFYIICGYAIYRKDI